MKPATAHRLACSMLAVLAALSMPAAAADFSPVAPWPVMSLVPQLDHQLLMGGNPAGMTGDTPALIRLKDTGAQDTTFAAPLFWYSLYSTVVLDDGSLLATGGFSTPYGWSFIRLGQDGSPTPTFQGWVGGQAFCAAPQADGRILLGGEFLSLSGQQRLRLGRYNPDGTLDAAFVANASDIVFTLALQPNGQILVGGTFTNLGGQLRSRIARLDATGAVDASLNPGANGAVVCLLVQPDGKIIVGGGFTTLGGQPHSGLGRLNPNGSLDSSFSPTANGSIQTMALQANGKILVGGDFTTVNGQSRSRLARLNADGTLDTSFTAGANNTVYSVALQEDGMILVGGSFTVLGGQDHTRAGRLTNSEAPTRSVTFDGATITWLRGGSLTEVWRTEAKAWTGAGWTNIGPGTRTTGGWQWTGLSLPPSATVRLLGHAKGGRFCASTWLPEAYAGPLALTLSPTSQTNLATTSVTFSGGFVGGEPITYRWHKDGVPLVDTADRSGSATHTLALASVLGGDAGAYTLVASNAFGALTSAVAVLSVVDPIITAQPTGSSPEQGSEVQLSVTAVGTEPLAYHWHMDGVPLATATNRILGFSSIQPADSGDYQVVVSNVFSSVTSSPARMSVSEPPHIVTPPGNQSNYLGATVTLTFTATGSTPLSYQWRKNGTAIASATDSVWTIPSLAHADIATYDVVVANSFGSVTSAPAAVVILNPYLLTQPASLQRNLGESAAFSVSAGGLAPLAYLWRKDGVPLAGATASTLSLTNLQTTNAGNFDLVVTNRYGAVTSSVATLVVSPVFPDSFNPGASGSVNVLAPLPDGRVLAGGQFGTLTGTSRLRLGRLNPDGSLDTTFTNASLNNTAACLALQPDGRVIIGGDFTSVAGQTRNHMARLNPDGTLEATFNPNVNGSVYALAVQPDGAILLGGAFSSVGGLTRTNLARLLPDGTVDTNFTAGAQGYVYTVALQPDGAILVGGGFIRLAGAARSYLGRLSSTGVPDLSFNPGANVGVNALVVQPDGKILVGGAFNQLGGRARVALGRLHADGTLDTNFLADANTYGSVVTLSLQADGSLFVGGQFSTLAGKTRSNLGRLTATGVLDESFLPAANGAVRCLAPLADGKLVLVGGAFTTLSGQTRNYLARLQNSGSGAQDSTFDGTTLAWLRQGTVPEVANTFAEAWTGQTWTNLGPGIRAGGGWRWTAAEFPRATTFRFQGRAYGGYNNGSSWWLQGYGGFPMVLSAPTNLVREAGGTTTLSVQVIGSTPFSYQWFRNGSLLSDGANRSGATTSNLLLTALACADNGTYSVIVSNYSGMVTSQVASLTIRDPYIATQPRSAAVGWTSNVTFTVTAVGTAPFAYQWRRAGVEIPAATDAALVVTNVQPADSAGYDVVVSGPCGTATSITAHLNQELADVIDVSGWGPGTVMGVAPLADGRILASGQFEIVGGLTRPAAARYNSDGTVDRSFNLGANPWGYGWVVQPDGSTLVAGAFTAAGGMTRNRLLRLTPNGSVDPSFNPNFDNPIDCLALQPDGRILAGGAFSTVGGLARSRIVRLQADGTVDASFNPGANGEVYSIAIQPDGNLLVGGLFTSIGGVSRSRLARLSSNGTVDPNFNPGADSDVHAVVLQSDGRILVSGNFSTLAGASRARIARLLPNGAIDVSLNPGADGAINCFIEQTDGRILVGGYFNVLGGQSRKYLARLNADGTLDGTWNPGADNRVHALALHPDGRVLIGGYFTRLGETRHFGIGHLDNTDLGTSTLTADSASVTWLRSGSAPQVWRTTFDLWNGGSWTNLGAGTRISGGWQLGGLSLSANATIRAQGFAVTGDDNCSSYIVEDGFGPPVVSIAPVNRTNFVGTTASLSAWVVGSGPVSYRWRKGGAELAEGGNLSGTGTPNLSLTNVQPSDSGWYSVVATNALGSVTSADVYLSVVPLQLSASGPGLGWKTNRQFAFQISGGAAWPVSVEASANLLNWQGLSTFWLGPSPAVFSDAGVTNYPVRAYRAAPVP